MRTKNLILIFLLSMGSVLADHHFDFKISDKFLANFTEASGYDLVSPRRSYFDYKMSRGGLLRVSYTKGEVKNYLFVDQFPEYYLKNGFLIGMKKDEVVKKLGKPSEIKTMPTSVGVSHVYYYHLDGKERRFVFTKTDDTGILYALFVEK